MSSAGIVNVRPQGERFRARLILGLLASLTIHAFILSLQFGIPGLGLPGLALPWQERRAPAPPLSVTLVQARSVAPTPIENVQESVAAKSTEKSSGMQLLQSARSTTQAVPAMPRARPRREPKPAPKNQNGINRESAVQTSMAEVIARTSLTPDQFTLPAPVPLADDATPTTPAALEPPAAPDVSVPDPAPQPQSTKVADLESAPKPVPDPVPEPLPQPKPLPEPAPALVPAPAALAVAEQQKARMAEVTEAKKLQEDQARQQAIEREEQKLQQQEAAQRALAVAARKQEEARKQEQAKAERRALELEAQKRTEEESLRQAAALARQQQAVQLAAKEKAEQLAAREKAEQLASHQKAEEAARQQEQQLAAQQKAADLASRQKAEAKSRAEAEAAQQRELERRSAENALAAQSARRDEKAGTSANLSGSDFASKVLAQARKLDLTRAEPQTQQSLAAAEPEKSGRRSIFGSLDKDIGLAMYIESWRLKIERNGRLNYAQSSRDKARGDPVVTVAIRSDGSVEDIVINRSSGRPELDESVRRIVRLNARYGAFPPALANKYDVIEIRRIWNFEDSLRILEEIR